MMWEAKMDIRSEQDLNQFLERAIEEALDAASEELLEVFKKKYIQKYVYESHGINEIYHGGSGKPTREFSEAWDWTKIKKQLNLLTKELWYNPSKLGFDMETFKHGSPYSTPPDSRASLMDILNKSGYSSSLWLSVNRDVPYWDKFVEDCFSGGLLERTLSKHFLAKGFIRI